jgi:hypothetical protein
MASRLCGRKRTTEVERRMAAVKRRDRLGRMGELLPGRREVGERREPTGSFKQARK